MRVKIVLAVFALCTLTMPAYARDTAFVCKNVKIKNAGAILKAADPTGISAGLMSGLASKMMFVVCENNKVRCYSFGGQLSCVKK